MKQDLQRIEATLRHLSSSESPADRPPQSVAHPGATAPSFKIATAPRSSSRSLQFFSAQPSRTVAAKTPVTAASPTATASASATATPPVQPFPARYAYPTPPVLPRLKLPSFSSHRHGFNTALPMNLLKEIEAVVEIWQTQLQQVLRQIQAIYAEGPLLDGWLDTEESSAPAPADPTTLRNAETAQLMSYVESVCHTQPQTMPTAADLAGTSTKRYRLCGLDADGRLWSRPCPPDQLASVSLAIARYRKLRLLLNHKEQLEIRLRQAAEALIEAQERLQTLFPPAEAKNN